MGGLHCSDCEFCSFCFNDTVGMYQAACARGYTLADPHIHHDIENFSDFSYEKIMSLISSLESKSEHPIAKSVTE